MFMSSLYSDTYFCMSMRLPVDKEAFVIQRFGCGDSDNREEREEVIEWIDGAEIRQQHFSVFLTSNTIILSFLTFTPYWEHSGHFCQKKKPCFYCLFYTFKRAIQSKLTKATIRECLGSGDPNLYLFFEIFPHPESGRFIKIDMQTWTDRQKELNHAVLHTPENSDHFRLLAFLCGKIKSIKHIFQKTSMLQKENSKKNSFVSHSKLATHTGDVIFQISLQLCCLPYDDNDSLVENEDLSDMGNMFNGFIEQLMKFEYLAQTDSYNFESYSMRRRRKILLLGTVQYPKAFNTLGTRMSQTFVPTHKSYMVMILHRMYIVLDSEQFCDEGTCTDKANILYAWARNAPPTRLPKGVGFRVGGETGSKYFVLQVHYGDISAFRGPFFQKKVCTSIQIVTQKQTKTTRKLLHSTEKRENVWLKVRLYKDKLQDQNPALKEIRIPLRPFQDPVELTSSPELRKKQIVLGLVKGNFNTKSRTRTLKQCIIDFFMVLRIWHAVDKHVGSNKHVESNENLILCLCSGVSVLVKNINQVGYQNVILLILSMQRHNIITRTVLVCPYTSHACHQCIEIYLIFPRQPLIAGMYLMMSVDTVIPAGEKVVNSDISCQYKKYPMHVFAYRVHTHHLGKVVSGYRVRNGQWTLIGRQSPQLPQAFYPVEHPVDVSFGDILAARCVFTGEGRTEATHIGSQAAKSNIRDTFMMSSYQHVILDASDHEKGVSYQKQDPRLSGGTSSDEMCNLYIMYYMEAKHAVSFMTCTQNVAPEMFRTIPPEANIPIPVKSDMVMMHGHHKETENKDKTSLLQQPKREEEEVLEQGDFYSLLSKLLGEREDVVHVHKYNPTEKAESESDLVAEIVNVVQKKDLGQSDARESTEHEERGNAILVRDRIHKFHRLESTLRPAESRVFSLQQPLPGEGTWEPEHTGEQLTLGVGNGLPKVMCKKFVLNFRIKTLTPEQHFHVEEALDWPGVYLLPGQVSGVALDPRNNLVIFHRGDHVWDGKFALFMSTKDLSITLGLLPLLFPLGFSFQPFILSSTIFLYGDFLHKFTYEEMLIKLMLHLLSHVYVYVVFFVQLKMELSRHFKLIFWEAKSNVQVLDSEFTWLPELNSFDSKFVYQQRGLGPIEEDTILVIDPNNAAVLQSSGKNLFYLPHGLSVDKDGNYWVTDVALHQVFKMDPNSKGGPLLTLGRSMQPGSDQNHFCQPTDVAVDPDTGTIYVSDGYCNSRIVQFSPTGKFITQWGEESSGSNPKPGQFSVPHSLALVPHLGQLCVADRENGRIQCFKTDTKEFAREIKHAAFGRNVFAISYIPGLLFAVNGKPYLGDQEPVQGFVMNFSSGEIIDVFKPVRKHFDMPHDITASEDGTVYVGDAHTNTVWKFTSTEKMEHRSVKKAGIEVQEIKESEAVVETKMENKPASSELQKMQEKQKLIKEPGSGVPIVLITTLLVIPVVVLLAIAIFIRWKKSRAFGGNSGRVLGRLRGKGSGGLNLGNFFASRKGYSRKGFDRLSTEGSDQEKDEDDGSESEEEYSAPLPAPAPSSS
ncbi:hypothetical protein HPG69_017168 [Diceros bicornis minor]|uniref:Peptidylglycine alpha-amidating monooxygenase n=1 Tax=Diceros bicornis minor TaxID=77932 RepID=A0A7J7ECT6_DICBM|nr:hypothetical protein HPG69_017168 [Diceros bicornis minor]